MATRIVLASSGSGELFSDTDGADVDASVRRYAAMAVERVGAAFPDAEVEMIRAGTIPGTDATVAVYDDGTDEADEAAIEEEVELILHDLWTDGAWIVESAGSVA